MAGCWPAWEGRETSVANTDASVEILDVQLLRKTGHPSSTLSHMVATSWGLVAAAILRGLTLTSFFLSFFSSSIQLTVLISVTNPSWHLRLQIFHMF